MLDQHPALAEIAKNHTHGADPYLGLATFVSEYVASKILSNPQAKTLFTYDKLHCALNEQKIKNISIQELPENARQLVHTPFSEVHTIHNFPDFNKTAQGLRRLRQQCMLRIIGRMACKIADTKQTLLEASILARWCIRFATNFCQKYMCAQYGIPKDTNGKDMELLVIGMGKLGVNELNLSSDVDLIFAISDNGITYPFDSTCANTAQHFSDVPSFTAIEAKQFFTRVGKKIISLLSDVDKDGFVFRVDMRLRPYGSGGSLIATFHELERYYFEQARAWERFALSRASILTGHKKDKHTLATLIENFVYRRHIDFGVISTLRELRNSISVHKANAAANDIKISRGGIREVEFFAQAHQLIYGGVYAQLRAQSTLQTLQICSELGLQTPQQCTLLSEAYIWLRDVENRIQALEDQQTHHIPQDADKQKRIALGMGFESTEDFFAKRQLVQNCIAKAYDSLLDVDQDGMGRKQPSLDLIWQSFSSELFAKNTTTLLNAYPQLADIQPQLQVFFEKLSQRNDAVIASLRLVIPHFLYACIRTNDAANALMFVLHLLTSILRRPVYLHLLEENLEIIPWLVNSCNISHWCAKQIVAYPMLLACYLEKEGVWQKPDRTSLLQQLELQMNTIAEDNLEEQMDSLRHFAMQKQMQAALAQLRGNLSLMQVSDYLSFIAEVCIHLACNLAWYSLSKRHGSPGDELLDGFSVLAFGKLGGYELSYASDLDIVFVHENQHTDCYTNGSSPISYTQFYQRLAQRIIHLLGAPTAAGFAYKIDTRLRPNGEKGLLCCSLAAWQAYYKKHAWTWEKQALIRSRPICGAIAMQNRCAQIRIDILTQPLNAQQLHEDIVSMRNRIGSIHGYKDTKHARGGMVDIEFIVQYLVLHNAYTQHALLTYCDNIRLLQMLERFACIDSTTAKQLRDCYLVLRDKYHHDYLGINSKAYNQNQYVSSTQPTAQINNIDETLSVAKALQQASNVWKIFFGDSKQM